jgi:hypothetical protein
MKFLKMAHTKSMTFLDLRHLVHRHHVYLLYRFHIS